MSFFTAAGSSTPIASIEVRPIVVRISRATGNGEDAPKYDDWIDLDRAAISRLQKGSSIAGPSYGVFRLALGAPGQIDVEAADLVAMGDRIAVGLRDEDGNVEVRWIWAGYVTIAQLVVGGEEEMLEFRAVGPEWYWGAGNSARGGATDIVSGQLRRTANGEIPWLADPENYISDPIDVMVVEDLPTHFNPDGHGNKGRPLVKYTEDPDAFARPFETPERFVGTIEVAETWDRISAAQYLETVYNVEGDIVVEDWPAMVVEFGETSVLRDANVDGMTLYDAMIRVLSPDLAFRIDPAPDPENPGEPWGGFNFTVFRRGVGDELDLTLPVRDTPLSAVPPGVVRVQATKDIGKTVNEVEALGKRYRHVKLLYRDKPSTQPDDIKRFCLQHGWTKGDGQLGSFADANNLIDEAAIDALSSGDRNVWRDRYCTDGRNFDLYRNVFRLFTWNEAAELVTRAGDTDDEKPIYSGGTSEDWYAPNLSGIADDTGFVAAGTGHPGIYARRRRRLFDTPYRIKVVDGWRRVRPVLFFAAGAEGEGEDFGPWIRIPVGAYEVDPLRAAIWMKEKDLSLWRPFDKVAHADEATQLDDRTFATLLLTGKLRMLLEATIETDYTVLGAARRQDTSGSPHVRTYRARAGPEFIVVKSFADGITSPTGMTADLVDQTAAAQAWCEQVRAAGEDEQTHASILLSAAAAEPTIGGVVGEMLPRGVSLRSRGGKGAQIVALSLDFEAMKWEALTETAAAEIRALDRIRIARRRENVRAAPADAGERGPINPNEAAVSALGDRIGGIPNETGIFGP